MSTLKDVAKECGLSVTTVSRALNNRGYISSEAHEKIQAAMKKLNYQPNEIARSLSKQSSKSIGVIMPYIDQPFFSRLLNYLELEADKRAIFFMYSVPKRMLPRRRNIWKYASATGLRGLSSVQMR